MKTIQIEDDLYQYIASKTEQIGESASDILRRLLLVEQAKVAVQPVVLKPLNQELQQSAPASVQTDAPQNKDAIVEHNGQSVFNVLNKEEVSTQKGAVGRFLFVLSALHRTHPNLFAKVLEVKGRERNYFGLSAEELNASGASIKPKLIPGSDYWVTTNNNTPRKKLIINEVASALGYNSQQAEELRELI